MSTVLERLSDAIFLPLGSAAGYVIGGLATTAKCYEGMTRLDGNIVADYADDPDVDVLL